MKNIEQELELSEDPITSAAKEYFGIDYLFPFQRLIISNILRAAGAPGFQSKPYKNPVTGKVETVDRIPHQIVILPTGAGKSLCFMLPARMLPAPTLVIFPLLSLIADQKRRVEEAGMKAAVLQGGQDTAERDKLWRDIEAGQINMVLTNPETALQEHTLRRISDAGFSHLVIDEMHTVSEWGESFRPTYLDIGKLTAKTGIPIVTAFTATASDLITEKVKKIVFPGLSPNIVTANPDRPNIGYTVFPSICKDYDLARLLAPDNIVTDSRDSAAQLLPVRRPAIVFCRSRTGAEMTAAYLRRRLQEDEIYFYHAGLDREEKTAVEEWFFTSESGILTATCAYGMGVDKKNVRTVIHRDLPPSVESYLQESGRGGRDRKQAEAILLYSEEDRSILTKMEGGQEKSRYSALLKYAEDTKRCRRVGLLGLLGAQPEACFGCDVCRRRVLPSAAGKEVISAFIKKRRRRYTVDEAVHILAGGKTYKIQIEELWQEEYFGALTGWEREEIELAITTLIREGSIKEAHKTIWQSRLRPAHAGAPAASLLCCRRLRGRSLP